MPWTWNLHTREFWPKRDLKKYPLWFVNLGHSYPAWTPLFNWMWCYPLAHGLCYGINEASIPTIRGSETRNIDGCALAGSLRISDENEIKERGRASESSSWRPTPPRGTRSIRIWRMN